MSRIQLIVRMVHGAKDNGYTNYEVREMFRYLVAANPTLRARNIKHFMYK